MQTTTKYPNETPMCPFCGIKMGPYCKGSSELWTFFRCVRDGYWTARAFDGQSWPSFKYSNAPDYQRGQECEWTTIVDQTRLIMQHKFRLACRRGEGVFLDIGCSEGAYVAGSAALGWKATGVEIDDAKVSRAQLRKLDVRNLNLQYESASLPCADFVMLRHVLEHVPDFVQFAMTAAAKVADGGVLWVECPNQSSLAVRRKRTSVREGRYIGALYPPTHIHAFEPQAFRVLGDLIGLKCERIITYAPSDPIWFPPYQMENTQFKSSLHKIAALLGYGNDVAIIYRKHT